MEAEKQAPDIYQWVLNIILSCTEEFHFSAVDSLIQLFNTKYNDKDLYMELLLQREIRYNQINGIIPPKYENG